MDHQRFDLASEITCSFPSKNLSASLVSSLSKLLGGVASSWWLMTQIGFKSKVQSFHPATARTRNTTEPTNGTRTNQNCSGIPANQIWLPARKLSKSRSDANTVAISPDVAPASPAWFLIFRRSSFWLDSWDRAISKAISSLHRTYFPLKTPSNSRHSPLDMPEFSCVTCSPFTIRRTQSRAVAERVAPPMR